MAQAYSWIEKTLGGIDILVNNAGVMSNLLFLESDNIKDLQTIMNTNIVGLCICTREAVKLMKARDATGHIININSIFGHKLNTCVPGTRPINGMYPASKYAITAVTECLRQELIYLETNIRISVQNFLKFNFLWKFITNVFFINLAEYQSGTG